MCSAGQAGEERREPDRIGYIPCLILAPLPLQLPYSLIYFSIRLSIMPKGKQSASCNSSGGSKVNISGDELIGADMPIARSLKNTDATKLGSLISSSLPGNPLVSEVTIKKSVGEAFTGGRSTPVYYITCNVMRPSWSEPRERRFVAKLVEMPGNAIDDVKLQKRRESYAVERRFYDVVAPRIRGNIITQLEIPKLLASDRDGSKPHPAVCFLMNDVRQKGFDRHPNFLSVAEAKRALKWVAAFHAIFWNDSKNELWRRDLWERGGFWTGDKDPKSGNAKISSNWAQTLRWLQSNRPDDITDATKGLGKRIECIAQALTKFLASESTGKQGTLLHGDYKAANLFFTNCSPDSSLDSSSEFGAESVAAVDFQFAGAGLGAEDVAYLLYPDARGHMEGRQDDLLRVYYDELILQLIGQQKGGPSSIPYDRFCAHYQLSRLDFTRHLLSKGWSASTDGDALMICSLEKTLFAIDGGNTLSTESKYLENLSKFVDSYHNSCK